MTSTLYSVDITSLYTNISHELGIEAVTYWIRRYRNLIPLRFTESFIIDSLNFILSNNNFIFNNKYYHQESGTAMGTMVAPPYACLTVAYLEETKLFPEILPQHFNENQCQCIEQNLKRYMDDGFLALLNSINFDTFLNCLNSMHPLIQFTQEKAIFTTWNKLKAQKLNFLDVCVILTERNTIETDVYYKTTNSHDYLNFESSHPEHTKRNVPFNLAKRIICFVSNDKLLKHRLNELRQFLQNCNYPSDVIEKGIFNAKLQGPAPEKSKRENIIPLVTTHFSNLNLQNVIRKTNHFFTNTYHTDLKETFQDCRFIYSQKQPKNLLRLLSSSKFPRSQPDQSPNAVPITKCKDKRCKICAQYLQCVDSFVASNGKTWYVKSKMSCTSQNVIYFLSCNRCDGAVTYIGKTVNLRKRTNGHISSCRTGKGSDIFDRHVYNCNGKPLEEPFFKLFLLLTTHEHSLLTYESHLHSLGYDTMNR